jgi:hypothetical protein
MDSLFMGAANSIAPELPLRVIMKPGGSFLMHTMKAAGAGAVGNMFSTVLQEGYDAGVLKEDMTWGEAIQRVQGSWDRRRPCGGRARGRHLSQATAHAGH